MSKPVVMENEKVVFLVLAGGFGKRLWPSSRTLFPKPLLPFNNGERSLLATTIGAISSLGFASHINVLVGLVHESAFRSHLAGMDTGAVRVNLISEPLSRNTAPAICMGVMRTLEEIEQEDAIFVVCPSDHSIGDKDGFYKSLKPAIEAAGRGLLTAIGIEPTRPETGYGYIKKGEEIRDIAGTEDVFKIQSFVEKPDVETARKYVKESFLWNCGIFVFKGSVMLDEIKKHAPKVFSSVRSSISKTDSFGVCDAKTYGRSPDISIDFAVMEKTGLGAVVPAAFNWDDIGSWHSVYKVAEKRRDGNAVTGDVVLQNCENCLVRSGGRLILANGLKDLVIVDEADALLVSDISRSGEIGAVVETFIRDNKSEVVRPVKTEHGWGSEKMVEKGTGFSVRTVYLKGRMEYAPQIPLGRIVVLEGGATAFVAEKSVELAEGDLLEVPDNIPVRVKNKSKSGLRLLEICFDSGKPD